MTFKAIEKHRYGLRETVSKHLKTIDEEWLALILFAGCLEPGEVSKQEKSHTSGKDDLYRSVQLKIVSGKQKGKILKHSEIVAHKQKGVEGRGGGGGGKGFFFSPAASIYKWEKNPLNFLLLS